MQQVTALRRKAQGKKAIDELYEEMGMFMPGPLSPRADSDGTNADDEEIRGELVSDSDEDDSDEETSGDDEEAIKEVIQRASPKGAKTVPPAPAQQEKSKGKQEKTNNAGDNPFPGIPLYNDKNSPFSRRRDTVSGPSQPEDHEKKQKQPKTKGLLKWGGNKKKESRDHSDAKASSNDKAKESHKEHKHDAGQDTAPPPLSTGREDRKTQPAGLPLDIAKFMSEMEAKQSAEKKKTKKGYHREAFSVRSRTNRCLTPDRELRSRRNPRVSHQRPRVLIPHERKLRSRKPP